MTYFTGQCHYSLGTTLLTAAMYEKAAGHFKLHLSLAQKLNDRQGMHHKYYNIII